MVLRAREPRPAGSDAGRDGGEGQGGDNGIFLTAPSVISRALPAVGMLAVSLILSAMVVGLLTAALV